MNPSNNFPVASQQEIQARFMAFTVVLLLSTSCIYAMMCRGTCQPIRHVPRSEFFERAGVFFSSGKNLNGFRIEVVFANCQAWNSNCVLMVHTTR